MYKSMESFSVTLAIIGKDKYLYLISIFIIFIL